MSMIRQGQIRSRPLKFRGALPSGVTLAELMVVLAILAALMSFAAVIFHLLFRAENEVTGSFVLERTISRLAVQFRDDVHRADVGTVMPTGSNTRSELRLSGQNDFNVR